MKAVRNAPPSVEVVDVDEPEGEGELVYLNSSRNSVLRCVVNMKGALPQR